MTWPRYFSYRATGAEFITELPSTWSMRSLKSLAAVPVANGVGEPGTFDNPDWPRYVRITDIASARSLRADTFASLPPETAADAKLLMGDLLLAAVGASFGKSYLHTQDIGPACFAGFMVRFRCGQDVLPEYASYWSESAQYWGQVQSRVVQSTIQNFSASRYGSLSVPLPPIADQRAIVSFLDREIAKVDALIAEQERLIVLLQEKRQAVISHAVTKGVDPNVPMKDSGLDWIGLIPAHWSVMTLRQVGTLLKGRGGSKQDASDEGVQCVRYGDLYTTHAYLINSSRGRIPLSLADGYFEIQRGDVLFAASGEDMADIGKSAVSLISERAFCGGDFVVLRPSIQLDALFSGYAFDAHYAKAQKASLGRGTTVKHIYPDELGRVTVAIPPHNEQQAIAAFVSDELERNDVLRASSIQTITLLRERRTALITAAVTGQIDVRGLVEAV